MLLLGAATVFAVLFFEQRTTDAVSETETLLTEQVVEGAVNRSSSRGAREVGQFVDEWIETTQALADRSDVQLLIAQAADGLRSEGVTADTSRAQATALIDTRIFAPTGRLIATQGSITASDIRPEITIISNDGYRLGSTNRTEQIDFSNEIWFNDAMANGVNVRAFVIEGEEGVPSLEIAARPDRSPAGEIGVIRLHVPLSPLLGIVDELAVDDQVNVVVIDRESSVLLADTINMNSEEFLYNMGTLAGGRSGANLELLREGTYQDALNLTSARSIETSVGPAQVNWLIQTQQPIERATESLSTIQEVSEDLSSSRRVFVYAIGGLLLLSLLVALLAIRALSNRITAPIRELSEQAQFAADEGIPSVVEAAQSSADILPELDPFEVETNDEIALLADSLNTMQDAATDLAAGQVQLRRQNVARTFVSLGRRNQNLLNRQLEFIDELEEQESNPETLENLFRLDHLATRMRRNAENLLVLAGEQTPRKWSRPIAVRDVIRAAASEIADYTRVQMGDIEPATVSGNVATDLSHLLAEVLENAGNFSPPSTNIEVLGQRTATHYRMAVVDQGIGLDPEALENANNRLQNPVDFADAPSAYLGLFVVGHLASQLGITVRLANADPTGEGRRSGTIAFIDMPVALLTEADATPVEDGKRAARLASQDVPLAEQVAESIAAPQHEQAPAAAPAAAPVQPAEAPAATTTAGFPKRNRGVAPAESPVPHIAPEPSAGVTEATPAVPGSAPTPAPSPAPAAAEAVGTTSAGFPKRRSSPPTPEPGPAAVQDPPATPPATPQRRTASDVSSSLRSFREAVAKGREQASKETAGLAQTMAHATQSPDQGSANSAPPAHADHPATNGPAQANALPVDQPFDPASSSTLQPPPIIPTPAPDPHGESS